MNVIDELERKQYGLYIWANPQGKNFWKVKPAECEVYLPSGEKKVCRSSDEFNELVKPYMEE